MCDGADLLSLAGVAISSDKLLVIMSTCKLYYIDFKLGVCTYRLSML